MTDEQIRIELARRVHGWKIAPIDGDAVWDIRDKNFPCLHNGFYRAYVGDRGKPWNPFSSWDDAMGLVRVHPGYQDTVFEAVYKAAEVDEYYESPGSWLLFKATPRDICLAMARAAGIEVEG